MLLSPDEDLQLATFDNSLSFRRPPGGYQRSHCLLTSDNTSLILPRLLTLQSVTAFSLVTLEGALISLSFTSSAYLAIVDLWGNPN